MPDDFNRGIAGSLRHVDTKIGKKGNPRNKKEKLRYGHNLLVHISKWNYFILTTNLSKWVHDHKGGAYKAYMFIFIAWYSKSLFNYLYKASQTFGTNHASVSSRVV